jgi:MtN3 and saliva related transmembrane protein
MTALDILGMTAGCISAITFLPQVIKTWKSKSAEDVSLLMFTFAHLCYTMTGLWYLLKNIPIIFTNATVLVFSIIMLYFKFSFRSEKVN